MKTIVKTSWHHSIIVRILVICFVCIHLPMLALMASLNGLSGDNLMPFLVVLGATLAGTVICLTILWRLTSPLRLLVKEIGIYRLTGRFDESALSLRGEDEIAGVTRAVCGMVGEIGSLVERLDAGAGRDPLTGLASLDAAFEQGDVVLDSAMRDGEPLSVIVLELIQARAPVGIDRRARTDKALVTAGDVLRAALGPEDIGARMNGSCFLLILQRTGARQAKQFSEDLMRDFAGAFGTVGAPTLNFGYSTREPAGDASLADLIHKADMALYRAKEAGPNRVEFCPAP